MSWASRLKLFLGVIVVLGVVAGCTLVFTQRRSAAQSATATIEAETFTVGAVYAGTVVDQLVQPGDTVAAGDPLLTVHSVQLSRDLEDDVITPAELDGVDTTAGTYQVVAAVDGTVASIDTPVGDFVTAGGTAATLDRAGSLTVSAQFALSPRDYGRVADGADVDLLLPDDAKISGQVSKVEVETVDGQAKATVTVTSPSLSAETANALYRPGTPVRATLHLRDDGLLAGPADAFRDFMRRLGL